MSGPINGALHSTIEINQICEMIDVAGRFELP